jgi:hypothetical protein
MLRSRRRASNTRVPRVDRPLPQIIRRAVESPSQRPEQSSLRARLYGRLATLQVNISAGMRGLRKTSLSSFSAEGNQTESTCSMSNSRSVGSANGNRTRILALKGLRANRCTIAPRLYLTIAFFSVYSPPASRRRSLLAML